MLRSVAALLSAVCGRTRYIADVPLFLALQCIFILNTKMEVISDMFALLDFLLLKGGNKYLNVC